MPLTSNQMVNQLVYLCQEAEAAHLLLTAPNEGGQLYPRLVEVVSGYWVLPIVVGVLGITCCCCTTGGTFLDGGGAGGGVGCLCSGSSYVACSSSSSSSSEEKSFV